MPEPEPAAPEPLIANPFRSIVRWSTVALMAEVASMVEAAPMVEAVPTAGVARMAGVAQTIPPSLVTGVELDRLEVPRVQLGLYPQTLPPQMMQTRPKTTMRNCRNRHPH